MIVSFHPRLLRMLPLLPAAWLAAKKAQKTAPASAWKQCRAWSKRALHTMGYQVHAEGLENLPAENGYWLVCNHQGTLDPALLLSVLPGQTAFISKKSNASLWMLGDWAQAIGTIHFDYDSRKDAISMIRQSVRRLKKKENLLIFPEGTRSKGDAMHPFKEHALQPAVLAGVPIVPVTISGSYALDRKDLKIRDLYVRVHPPILPCRGQDPKELSEQIFRIIEKGIVPFESAQPVWNENCSRCTETSAS